MSKLIEDAVKVLRALPDNVQEAAARAIINYGASHDDDFQPSGPRVRNWPSSQPPSFGS